MRHVYTLLNGTSTAKALFMRTYVKLRKMNPRLKVVRTVHGETATITFGNVTNTTGRQPVMPRRHS